MVGEFCETNKLSPTEIQTLFGIATKHDLTVNQTRMLLRDIRRKKTSPENGALFDLAAFSDRAVKVLKTRNYLDNCAAQAWWLYELVQSDKHVPIPEDISEPLMLHLRRFYAFCVGSDDEEVVPQRANKKGRKLAVNYEKVLEDDQT